MNTRELKIAASVLSKTGRDKPADGVLRDELRRQRELPPQSSATVARGIFAYYRWLGWLDKAAPLEVCIRRAQELQELFNRTPSQFTEADLLARAIPSWTAGTMNVSPAWCRALQAEPRLWLRARLGHGAE